MRQKPDAPFSGDQKRRLRVKRNVPAGSLYNLLEPKWRDEMIDQVHREVDEIRQSKGLPKIFDSPSS